MTVSLIIAVIVNITASSDTATIVNPLFGLIITAIIFMTITATTITSATNTTNTTTYITPHS